jgi:hypothetical protein
MTSSLSEWLVLFADRLFADWMTACLIEWPYHRLNYWFTVWLHLTEWLPDWLHDLTDWMVGLQTVCWINDCLIDWMTLSSTELLVHRLTAFDWMTAWLITWPHRLNDWFTDGFFDWMTAWMFGLQTVCWLNDCLNVWFTDGLSTEWLPDWLVYRRFVDWMTAWMFGLQTVCWLNDCLTDWFTDGLLTEWLPDWLNELIRDWIIGSRPDCLLTEWLSDWLNDVTDWMSVLLIKWLLTKWLPGWVNYRLTDSEWLTGLWANCLLSQWPPDRTTERLANWMAGLLNEWLQMAINISNI